MTVKAAAHSHASQFSIYDLPMVSVSPLIINSSRLLTQMNGCAHSPPTWVDESMSNWCHR